MQNNSDKFDHLISLSAIKCTEEDAKKLKDIDTSDVVFDASYHRKRNKLINKYRLESSVKSTKSVMIRVIAAILIMVMLSCALIGCMPRLREAIFNAIVRWYESYVTVNYDSQDGLEMETGYKEEITDKIDNDVVAPIHIVNVRKPTNLPEGVWEDLVTQTRTRLNIDYYCNEDYLFSFSQMLLEPNDKRVDNEDVDVTHIKINGNDATIVESIYEREIYIFWNDGEYSYHMFSTVCDFETLIKYAESVK